MVFQEPLEFHFRMLSYWGRNIISDQFNDILNYHHALHGLSLKLEKVKIEITEILAQKNEIVIAKESSEKALDD